MKRICFLIVLFIAASGIANAQFSKMSPFVRQAALDTRNYPARTKGAKVEGLRHDNDNDTLRYDDDTLRYDDRRLTAFVRTTDKEAVMSNGCDVLLDLGDIIIASIPLQNIEKLASMPQVKSIEAKQSAMQILNDKAALSTWTDLLWETPFLTPEGESLSGYTGKDVVVGVVDESIDFSHPTFRTADGQQLRIKAVWDWMDFSSNGSVVDFATNIGRQYVGEEQIMEKKHSADSSIKELKGHGTHTSATAAGSGFNGTTQSPYIGMAPEADLCFVATYGSENSSLIPVDKLYEYTNASDLLSYKYIFDYAESVGKPCVINYSMGQIEDLYQNQTGNEALSRLVGPGRILCASAGNNGNRGTYTHKPKGTEKAGAFLSFGIGTTKSWLLNSDDYPMVNLTFHLQNGEKVEWQYDTHGLSEYPDSQYTHFINVADQRARVEIFAYPSWVDKNYYATDLIISASETLIETTPISLTLTGTDIDIEAFAQTGFFTGNTWDMSLNDYDNTHNIEVPSAYDDAICVGSASYRPYFINYLGEKESNGTRTEGERSYFSSIGPNKKGNIKPEVMAPGQNIISALNSYYFEALPENSTDKNKVVETFNYNNRTYGWQGMSGTSMSTPVVTGIVALWLQECPTLTPDNIREVIAKTSIQEVPDHSYPNNIYGYGTINAKAGMDYIKEHFSTPSSDITTVTSSSAPAYYDLNGRTVSNINGRHGIFLKKQNGRTYKVAR